MPRYRYVGVLPAHIPDVPIEVQPGEEFDSDVELNSASLVLVGVKDSKPSPNRPEPTPAPQEDQA